jgi:hypothetical protein
VKLILQSRFSPRRSLSQAGVQMTKAIIGIPGPLGISRLHHRPQERHASKKG